MSKKTNTTKLYFYDTSKKWFKTKSARHGIPLTQSEAVKIINAYRNGCDYTEIYTGMSFVNPKVNEGTIRNFINKWNYGLMDKAMRFICSRCGLKPVYYLKYPSKVNHNTSNARTESKQKSNDNSVTLQQSTFKTNNIEEECKLREYAKVFGYNNVSELLDDLIYPKLDSMLNERKTKLLNQKELIEQQLSRLDGVSV